MRQFLALLFMGLVGILIGSYVKSVEGVDTPVVHKLESGFVCITYRETMICGQSTNTRPSQKGTNRDETLSVTYSIPQAPSYSTEF